MTRRRIFTGRRLVTAAAVLCAVSALAVFWYWPFLHAFWLFLNAHSAMRNGDYRTAIPLYERQSEVLRAVVGPTHRLYVAAMGNQGNCYALVGEVGKAERIYSEVLSVYRDQPTSGPRESRGLALFTMSCFYHDNRDFESAEECLRLAIENFSDDSELDWRYRLIQRFIYRQPRTSMAIWRTTCRTNLGLIALDKGEIETAIRVLNEVLSGEEEVAKSVRLHALCGLAIAQMEQGNLAEAESRFLNVMRRTREIPPYTHAMEKRDIDSARLSTLSNLTELYMYKGDLDSAADCLQQRMELHARLYADAQLSFRRLRLIQVRLLLSTGRMSEAAATLDDVIADEIAYRRVLFSSGTDRMKRQALAARGTFDCMANAFVFEWTENNAAAMSLAADLAVISKQAIIESAATERAAARASGNPEWRRQYETLADLRREYQESVYLVQNGYKPKRPLADLERLITESELALSRLSPETAIAVRSRAATAEDVAAALPADAVLLDFVRYDSPNLHPKNSKDWNAGSRYGCFVLRSGRPVRAVALGDAVSIDTAINEYRARIYQHIETRSFAADDEAVLISAGIRLHELVLKPIADAGLLDGARHVVVSPDGGLASIPFEILVDAPTRRYLLQDVLLSYVDSPRDVLHWQDNSARGHGETVIIGDPDFALKPEAVIAAIEGAHIEQASFAAVAQSEADDEEKFTFAGRADVQAWEPLSETNEYCRGLAELFGTEKVHLGANALEDVVKKVRRPRILAIATHGFYTEDTSAPRTTGPRHRADEFFLMPASIHASHPLLRSGLVFAGANHHAALINAAKQSGIGVNDGYLTAYEVASLDLEGTECVSLTACETGLGDMDNVEVLGLRSAFKHAGARTVLVSLWKLPVGPATRESLDFYSAWMSGRHKAEAHRTALLSQLERSRAQHGSGHPVLWAGTILVGDPR